MNCVNEMNRNTGETSTRSRKWGPVQFFTSGGAVQLMHCSRFEMPRLTVGQIGRFHIGFSALLHPQKFQDERDFRTATRRTRAGVTDGMQAFLEKLRDGRQLVDDAEAAARGLLRLTRHVMMFRRAPLIWHGMASNTENSTACGFRSLDTHTNSKGIE